MTIIFLDSGFNIISRPADNYSRLVWTPKYYTSGSFELSMSTDWFITAKAASYIYNTALDEAAVIESIQCSDGKLLVKGRMLESLFDCRIFDSLAIYEGQLETVIQTVVTQYALTGDRAIPNLVLGQTGGFTDSVSLQTTIGLTLSEWLREVLRTYEMSYKIHYDFLSDVLVFSLYKGLDRTQNQSVNNWAVFSTSYENLLELDYKRDTEDTRNYVYVITEDDSVYGKVAVEIDLVPEGGQRREFYVNGGGIKSRSDGVNMTREQFIAALTEKGMQELAKIPTAENIGGSVNGSGILKYGVNFNLGDLCDISDYKLGLNTQSRITEVNIISDSGGIKYLPKFN